MNPILPPIDERTLHAVLAAGVQAHPDRPAITDPSLDLTYRELWDRARRTAGGLRAVGVGDGDAVLMMLDSSADCLVLLAATSFLGAVAVPTNLAYSGPLLEHLIAEAGCTAAVVDDRYVAAVEAASHGRLESMVVRGGTAAAGRAEVATRSRSWDEVLAGPPVEPLVPRPDTVFAIIFTSGTTGASKGVLTTHAQAFTMCYCSPHAAELGASERWYVPTPMFHALGLFGGAIAPLIFGGSSYIAAGFSPTRFWDDVRRSGATTALLVGTMIDLLLDRPPTASDRDHSLRHVNVVPGPRSAAEFADRFGVVVTTSYGSSENGTSFADWSGSIRLSAVGVPRPGLRVRLVDRTGSDVPTGAAGELLLKPEERAEFMTGYVQRPEESAAAWRGGWFATGDVMRRDEEGHYYFVDRLRDSIRRRGENISSLEVEMATVSHPAVSEVAAVGVGDPSDQEVMIVVIREDGAQVSELDLLDHLIDRLPYFAVPRFVMFAVTLPRTPTGKIRKAELRSVTDAAWDREAAGIRVTRTGRTPILAPVVDGSGR